MSGRKGTLLADAKLFELSPDQVDEGERIGFLHEDKAAAIGRLMAVDGQRDPIKVVANKKNPDKPWRLVTGMHRLIGARLECITVWAIEVTGKPEDLADLEASENLHRRPLAPIERAKFVAALCQAAQERIARQHGELSQQKLAIRARWERVKAGETRVEEALQEENLHSPIHLYGLDGRYLCSAELIADTGFLDAEGAKATAKRARDYRRRIRDAAEAEQLLHAEQVAALQPDYQAPAVPEASVVRPVRHRGHTAAALKAAPVPGPIVNDELESRVTRALRLVSGGDE